MSKPAKRRLERHEHFYAHQWMILEKKRHDIMNHMPKEITRYLENPPWTEVSTPLEQSSVVRVGKKGAETAVDKESYAMNTSTTAIL